VRRSAQSSNPPYSVGLLDARPLCASEISAVSRPRYEEWWRYGGLFHARQLLEDVALYTPVNRPVVAYLKRETGARVTDDSLNLPALTFGDTDIAT
jgi:hypothetical protein